MKTVAVIDVGSNSIKCLVVRRLPHGGLVGVYENTLPVRISAGINAANPRLGHTALDAGSEAIAQLVSECERKGPLEAIHIVATSAVRDASNAYEFDQLVYDRTGYHLRILSGADEARLIGRGIIEDPALMGVEGGFCAADLGGGSLELIEVRNGAVERSVSLQVGTVRLAERFLKDPRQPLQAEETATLRDHVRTVVTESGFPLTAPLVGTGGIITVWRSIVAQTRGLALPEVSPELPRPLLTEWIEKFGFLSWEERLAVPGLPSSRADILPVGFVIIDTLLELGQTDTMTHSRFNLRYGLAAELFA